MSFKEVTLLRKSGKLKEAYQMAKLDLEAQPDNIENKCSIAWVYYEYLKLNKTPEKYEQFVKILLQIKALNLPEDKKMIFDQCAWQIGKLVFLLNKSKDADNRKIKELFSIIQGFHFTKPSKAYSYIFKAFKEMYKNGRHYLTFADWWNFNNFLPEDYLVDSSKNQQISLVEEAYNTYAKYILKGESFIVIENKNYVFKETVEAFLPRLDSLMKKHPEYQFLPYYKAKLLLEIDDNKNALSTFLPFARQKRNEFWIWTLMAEIFSGDKDAQFSCYCKALSLKTSDKFLTKLRQTFAKILIEKKMYNEAKTEIQNIIATRKKEGWEFIPEIKHWTEKEWYQSAIAKKDNMDLYSKFLKEAEEILYQDIPEELVAVEFVNKNKSILNFVKDKQKFGFFNYSESLSNPQIGDLLKVRFHGEGQDGFYKILTAKKVDSNLTSEAIKHFQGTLKVIPPQNFGFVEDVFIDSQMVEKYKLNDGQTVEGRAILSFNKKKDEWGWKGIEIKNN